ncbi:nuclear hormone receptor HR96 isoform X2 [Eurytemora carolleeae]|uniref:nuclear hormone receptor HR96 isoform X2 n=1 Tax=Eurytemora carolleeae TaxID=1294199 RepID=UPI000C7914D8|nr:nuclear hormone receptor HR96 isoform X2 [Eurytemora carolleeae]|eukprot:XP_023337390.1 nuclear hormone receptor HR96-like isoform X2 [Eurytemora affinis]
MDSFCNFQASVTKDCIICGDAAIGNNFGVVSCESCKAFFRRNANKVLVCNFSSNCTIDKFTRKFCQKCRQRKCLEYGMKRELIKTENRSRIKKKRIELMDKSRIPEARIEPRYRSYCSEEYSNIKAEEEITQGQGPSRPLDSAVNSAVHSAVSAEVHSAVHSPVHSTVHSPVHSALHSTVQSADQSPPLEMNQARTMTIGSLINAAISTEFQLCSEQPSVTLNEREKARINELCIASKSLDEPFKEDEQHVVINFQMEPKLISVLNLTNLAVKRIINMTKQISAFANLCQEDQLVLLKGGCLELMLLRSVLSFNSEKNTWQLPGMSFKEELSMDVLKEASVHGVNLYEEHQRFASSFPAVYRTDETIMLLLSAIALFSQDRNNMKHKTVVQLEQDTYYYLLKRYLDSKFGGCKARESYLELIGILLQLRELNDSHLQLFMEMDPREIEPLLREIFDLHLINK